jgi:hypothetical protein
MGYFIYGGTDFRGARYVCTGVFKPDESNNTGCTGNGTETQKAGRSEGPSITHVKNTSELDFYHKASTLTPTSFGFLPHFAGHISLLHALFFLISSVTRTTSTAARAFGIANQSQARPGCPCTRWGFSDFDFLSVDSDVAILNSLIVKVTLICIKLPIDYSIEKLASVKYIAFGMRTRYHQNSLNHMVLGGFMVEPSKCPFRWFWWPDLMVLAPKPSKCAIRWFWFCHEIVQVINV